MNREPLLQQHKVVPLFTLPDKYGDSYNLAKRRGNDHWALMIFAPGVDPRAYLQAIAGEHDEWRILPAHGIVVVPDESTAGELGSLPFTILIDADDHVRSRFLPDGAQAGVFALDRYGSLYQQWLADDLRDLPAPDDLTGWMQAIGMQCSI
jgi:hypothetical protein